MHNKNYTKYILYMDPKRVVLVTFELLTHKQNFIIKFSLNSTCMRSTYIINYTHNKLCAYVQMYIYVEVSLRIAQLKKMRYTYMPQALK